jgi:carbohydrate binding protein with CBM6 domain
VNGTANSYRPDGVDLETCSDTGCGYDVGWTSAGQWFSYTVDVATAGTHTISFRLASPSGVSDALHIANSAGTSLSGAVSVPDTGGWQDWTTVTATVTLPAGVQTLTVDQDNAGWNIYQMTFG